jgi:hypothetical protein
MSASTKAPAAQRPQIDAAIANLVMLQMNSSEEGLLHESKVREQLGYLLGSLEGAYARPTAAEYAAYKEMDAEASAGEERLGSLTSR